MSAADDSASFCRGRRVLVTGHTGFKGALLCIWLHLLGAEVTGLALPPSTEPNLFTLASVDRLVRSVICDVGDAKQTAAQMRAADPEIVFHMAAQALVRESYRDAIGTFMTNVQGTVHVLDALRSCDSARVVVAVTTDKVYRNLELGFPFRETDVLGGHDPYSASKAAAELVVDSYRSAFLAARGIAVASARAGAVIGGGDWSADRLIPDVVRAWESGRAVVVRRPESIRPWQHVLEPLSGYMRLAEKLWRDASLAGAYNFGPSTHEAASVRRVIELGQSVYQDGAVEWPSSVEGPHEAGWLALETAKARTLLGVSPRWRLDEAVRRTLHWYRRWYAGADAYALCTSEIAEFIADGRSGGSDGTL